MYSESVFKRAFRSHVLPMLFTMLITKLACRKQRLANNFPRVVCSKTDITLARYGKCPSSYTDV